jgi:predicted AAA+ superfamily ATPase
MRYLTPFIVKDLKRKMVFLGGPRQCGKTTLAQSLSINFDRLLYLNWDNNKHRKEILQEKWAKEDSLIVFDELHKYKLWKNWIKGHGKITNNLKVLINTEVYAQSSNMLQALLEIRRDKAQKFICLLD